MNIFERTVKNIEEFYSQGVYNLGWRFLNCSKLVLDKSPQVAFITLNPGGREIPQDQPWASCENGNSYTSEVWGGSPRGKSNLQNQVQKMFEIIATQSGYSGTSIDLIEESLCGYFVPFRSGRLEELPDKKEAFAFGKKIWAEILKSIKPRMFICIDRETFKLLRSLIGNTYDLKETTVKTAETGWGNYMADLIRFGQGEDSIKLLRLPHLSTFKLFTSAKCKQNIFEIFADLCDYGLRSKIVARPTEKNVYKSPTHENKASKKVNNVINAGVKMSLEDEKIQLKYGAPKEEAYVLVRNLKNKNAIACALHTIFASSGKSIEEARKHLNSFTENCRSKDGYTSDAMKKSNHYSESYYEFLYTNIDCTNSKLIGCLPKVGDILTSSWAKYVMKEIDIKPNKVFSFWSKTARVNGIELI